MMDDRVLARGMLSLKGECCTLSHQRSVASEARAQGYMRFDEWPSGHWRITPKGYAFIEHALSDEGSDHAQG